MTKIFLSTHAGMASGMKSSIDLLLGESSCLTVFDAYLPGQTTTVKDAADAFLATCSASDTVLMVSDMLGGSVNQQLMQYITREKTYILTGITLQLLQALVLCSDEDLTAEEIDEMVEQARLNTKRVTLDVEINGGDFF